MAGDPKPKVRLVSKAQDRINIALAPLEPVQRRQFDEKAAEAAAATARRRASR